MKKIFLAIIILITLFLVIWAGKSIIPKALFFNLPDKIINPSSCSQAAQFVIDQKGFDQITDCNEEKYLINGKEISFIYLIYGPAQDCPSGCIYDTYYGVVEDDKITDFGFLREDLLEAKIHLEFEPLCSLDQGYEKRLIKEKGEYKWKVTFKEEERDFCVLNGFVLVYNYSILPGFPSLGGSLKIYDFSNINSKYTTINCDDQIIAEKVCLIYNQVNSRFLCEKSNQIQNGCLYYKAAAEKNLEICEEISNNLDLTDLCYYDLAIRLNDSSICETREWSSYYYENNCKNKVK